MKKVPKVILLIETSREAGRGLLRGIAKYSRLHGPWMFYREPPVYIECADRKRNLQHLRNWKPDGVITRDTENVEEILSFGLPTIIASVTGKEFPGVPNIIDCDTVGKIGAEYFLERGFRNFAYCGFEGYTWSDKRAEGFISRIAQAGFKTNLYRQPKSRTKRKWENEQVLVADWLKSLPKPVGLMTCGDTRSQHIIDACRLAGLHVPEEVAVLGVDNDELVCTLSDIPLSSIALGTEGAGYEAAELLDRLMSGKFIRRGGKTAKSQIILQPTHVVTRQSTDILAIEDKEVAAAIRFIQQHAKDNIQITDVANEVAMSYRTLYRRFRRALGRTVHDEINRIRIEQITQLLLQTNLSIKQIALSLGYDVANINRSFRKLKGMSPLQFRKAFSPKV